MFHVGKYNMASQRSTVLCLNRLTWISLDCLLFLVVLDGRRVREVVAMRQPCGVRQMSLHRQVIVFDLSACLRLCRLLMALYFILVQVVNFKSFRWLTGWLGEIPVMCRVLNF